MWEQFTITRYSAALRLDSLKSFHPIQVPIKHAEEVEQVFDSISYSKGSCVVRMIKSVLGMKYYQQGLRNYMKNFAYGNTETLDLWNAWEEVSQMPIVDLMTSWTEQMGYPMLRITKEDWQENVVVFDLEQIWFLSDGSELDEDGKSKKWNIPILTATDQGIQSDMMIMREKTASITIPLSMPNSWVKLNANHEILMRVLATPEMYKRLHIAIETKQLNPIDRAGILNDTYAFVKAGHLSPKVLIELICYYENEDEYVVWEGLSSALNGLDAVLSEDRQMSDLFRKFAKPLILSLLKKMGWQSKANDGHIITLLRSTLMSLVSKFAYDDEEIVAEVRTKIARFLEDANDVDNLPSDVRPQAFRIFLKNGGEFEYNTIKHYFTKAETNAEQKHVLVSLGSTPDPKLKLLALEWSISGEIKLQDFHSLMSSVGASSNGGNEVCWQFYQDNFEKIQLFLGSGSSVNLSSATILACAGHFYTTEKANKINEFFEANPMPRNTRAISQMIENMRSNARFLNALKSSELSSSSFWAILKRSS